MPEEIRPPGGETPPLPEHPDVRSEPTDANFRAILFILIGSVVVGAIIYGLVTVFFNDWQGHEAAVKQSPFPLAPGPSTALPAGPRLEQIDRMAGIERPNVNERFTTKEEVLNSYGPTDEEGFVHIPIERAMKMLENKLPARAEPPADQSRRSDGLVDSGEPNSGREFRGRPR